jgi:hypothetical protein
MPQKTVPYRNAHIKRETFCDVVNDRVATSLHLTGCPKSQAKLHDLHVKITFRSLFCHCVKYTTFHCYWQKIRTLEGIRKEIKSSK